MNKFKSIRVTILLILSIFFSSILSAATGNFVATSEGMRYVYKNANGVTTYVNPKFDSQTGTYYVVNDNNQIIARQQLPKEAAMNQIKIVAPTSSSNSTTQDFMGNDVQILTPMASSDPRYKQLRSYIENNKSFRDTVSLQIQARDYKIKRIQQDVAEGVKDPTLAAWLTNDLKKPVYLEVGNSGSIYHDGSGFVLAETGSNGQTSYRDNSYVNRIVISDNSEIFSGNNSDPNTASIMSHEMGHMIMDQLYETPNYPSTNYYGSHSKNTISDEGFAISEGWAEALEAISTKDYRARYGSEDSWRLKTHQNIEDNNYIYKDAGVTNAVNNGYLKTSGEMLSTEGVNASMFYNMLESNKIQNPYGKVFAVFEESKPQTYRDFVYDYIQKYPEDRSTVIKMFLEDTKYTTVDSSAAARYKDLYDAEQAYLNATDPYAKYELKYAYESKKQAYDQYNNDLYRQAAVDGTIDNAVVATDRTNSSYRALRLKETLFKTRSALDTGVQNAGNSLKNSFSAKNIAMTAGTSIAINLASQLMNGEKVSLKTAAKAVASMEFVGNFVGSSLGAAAGQLVVPLVRTFVPGIVGTLAGALIPSVTSLVGGNIGGNLGAGKTLKESLKSLDMVAVAGQAIGSTLGSMLGSFIPIPIVGTMLGGIVGGILGEKLFTAVRNLFKKKTNTAAKVSAPTLSSSDYSNNLKNNSSVNTSSKATEPGLRISDELDSVSYSNMSPDLRALKDDYENAYKAYTEAAATGDAVKTREALKVFRAAKSAYELALKSVK